MLRTAALLAFVFTFGHLAAAPAPPPGEKELLAKLWGKTEGPGEFKLVGKQLRVRTVGLPAQGLIKSTAPQTPHVARTVTGDFEVTVKVLECNPPNKDAKHDGSPWPCTRAGLYISGNGYAVEIHLMQYHTKINNVVREELSRVVWVDTWYPRGGSGSSLRQAEPGKTAHLRITRKDKTVSVSYSFDGKTWSAPFTPRAELDFPDEVTVGVYLAPSTHHQPVEATFDGLTIEKLKVEPKSPAAEPKK